MKKILTTKVSIVSAIRLRNLITELTGVRYPVIKEPEKAGKSGVLIRYGNSAPLARGIPDTNVNTPEFCAISVHKGAFSKAAISAGLAAPDFHTTTEPREYPVLVRTTLTGSQGRGITVCKNVEEFRAVFEHGNWWTPYVRTTYEVRALVVNGEVLKTFYKLPFADMPEGEFPIRSGYHFKLVDHANKFEKLKEAARTIFENMNGKFFAVDAGWDPARKEYFIFEINSGPGMNDLTCDVVGRAIIRVLGLEMI